jgi:hypothetical protein
LLWLEKSIKVPEGGLHEAVGGHLGEAHLEEDVPEFGPHFEQRMQMAAGRRHAHRLEVVLLEMFVAPGATWMES